jgi:hypothetical protein
MVVTISVHIDHLVAATRATLTHAAFFGRFGRASVPLAQKGVERRGAVLGERSIGPEYSSIRTLITSDLGSFRARSRYPRSLTVISS